MNRRGLFVRLFVFSLRCFAAEAPLTEADCTVSYAEGEGMLDASFTVTVSEKKPKMLPQGSQQHAMSPQRTSTLTNYSFDSQKAGSGTVVTALQTRRGKHIFLSFSPAIGSSAQWLNEDLVYLQVWWGRIAASEMVFDASTKKFVYRKLANYGYLSGPDCAQFDQQAR